MKKIFNFIKSVWNKFLNPLKKKIMPIEQDIKTLIDTFISNNRNVFENLLKLNCDIDTTFKPINQNSFEVIVKFSTIFKTSIETQLIFSNLNKNHVLDITDGVCNFKNSNSVHRSKVYTEIDILNNRLNDKYETIFKKYYP